MVLKAFLSRAPEAKREALLRFLPEPERLKLAEIPAFEEKISPERYNLLEYVHWSWFLPTLKTYPEKEQKLFLSALSPVAAQNLSAALDIPDFSQKMSETARGFFNQILMSSLLGPHHRLTPIDYIAPSPVTPLLRLSKKELIQLISLLSLYDLSAELRQIVETKILKKIYSFLSKTEQKFLKQIMAQQKESLSFLRMGLDRWDGTEEAFRHQLHRKGLIRFAAALSGQDPDLIWYIGHQLDIGRGTTLLKLCAKETAPSLTEGVIRQIEELLANPDRLI
jgi:hypothetical protein